jgi:hypothetical protein
MMAACEKKEQAATAGLHYRASAEPFTGKATPAMKLACSQARSSITSAKTLSPTQLIGKRLERFLCFEFRHGFLWRQALLADLLNQRDSNVIQPKSTQSQSGKILVSTTYTEYFDPQYGHPKKE